MWQSSKTISESSFSSGIIWYRFPLLKMKRKYSIVFFLAIVLLIICEYIFLAELNDTHRFFILFLAATGVVISSLAVIFCYVRSAKEA
jgi:predicted membrane channel-forming protein YqfA (hemolysin III family)